MTETKREPDAAFASRVRRESEPLSDLRRLLDENATLRHLLALAVVRNHDDAAEIRRLRRLAYGAAMGRGEPRRWSRSWLRDVDKGPVTEVVE